MYIRNHILSRSTTLLRLRNRYFFFLDIIFLSLMPILALALRLDGFVQLQRYARPLLLFVMVFASLKLIVFLLGGLYSRYWRYASIEELVLILELMGVAGVVELVVFFMMPRLAQALPRSLPFLDILLVVPAITLPRFSVRLLARRRDRRVHGQRVLIIGAGDAGQLLAREMRQNPTLGLDLVGFIDDDVQKQGLQLRGVPILGGRQRIAEVVRDYKIQQVVIAIPSAPGRIIRSIVDACNAIGVKQRILPGFDELLNSDVSLRRLRSVRINDLLRRDPVQTDIVAVEKLLRGRRVLVTGGGGSIGSELCRQIWRCHPAELILLGHGENSIFGIYHELREIGPDVGARSGETVGLRPVIADIRFPERLHAVFNHYRPQIVFHAAAHKHVPLMEMNPAEAITNNVLGTRNILAASLAAGVEHFVMISTDKAVNPTSIMGASKRAAELLVHSAAKKSGHSYVAVRFGNVLGSRGSVVLTFQRQIANGGPVTVTHPEMRRFFMTIPEAVQLVLQASVLGTGGEVFLLDMGEPVKIVDLAQDLIELSGLRLGEDIEITFTGMRPGEKLFEELFVNGERYEPTRHEKIFIAANASQLVPDKLDRTIDALERAARRNDKEAIFLGLRHLIPEFQPVGESVVGNGRAESQMNDGNAPTATRSIPEVSHSRPT